MKKYHYDRKSDSLQIVIKEGEEDHFEEVVPGITLEYNAKNELIGVEVLKASRFQEKLKEIVVNE